MEDAETKETEAVLPVNLEKAADELPETVAEDGDDWMKQLDDLEDAETKETEAVLPVNLEKAADELPETVAEDGDDWMKQLDDLEDAETKETEAVLPVNLAKSADELPETVAEEDDDWMAKQLDALEDAETKETEAVLPVNLAKSADELPETVAEEDDDWMAKQLDALEEHDEETAQMLMDAGSENISDTFNIADEADAAKLIDEDALVTKAAELAASQAKENHDLAMSQLRADQDSVDSKNRQQFVEVEKKRKKTATFGYIALGVGVIGLLGSAGIGWLSYETKKSTVTLNESVTALEEKVTAFLAKNPEKEIENLKVSVEQLNQKVEKIATAQISVPAVAAIKPNSAVDLLNGKAAVPALSNVKTESATTGSLIVTETLGEGSSGHSASGVETTSLKPVEAVKLADMSKKSAKKAEAVKAAEIDKETEKAQAEAELLSQKIAKANAVARAAAAASYKNDAQRKVDSYSGRMTRGMAHAGSNNAGVATKTNVKTPVKEILNTEIKSQKAVPAGKYSVNVISYQQEWFAQSKAAELKQKGIPVEVVPVDPNNSGTKFRLKVGGFKSKAEASAYADKIKKSNGGNEPWVGINE